MILLASLLALPQALVAQAFIPEVWNPKHMFVFVIGLEDILFSFFFGGMVWISMSLLFSRLIQVNFKLPSLFKRYVICIVYGSIVSLGLFTIGVTGYIHSYIIMIVWAAIMVYFKAEFLLMVLSTAFFLGVLYFFLMQIAIILWPDLPNLWNWKNLSGINILELPIEELVWMLLYGLTWSLSMVFFLDAKLIRSKKQPNNRA